MKTKLIQPHDKACARFALKQHKWFFAHEVERIYLDAIGRKSQHRGWGWIVATCNGCGVAKLAIREADIIDEIAEGRV